MEHKKTRSSMKVYAALGSPLEPFGALCSSKRDPRWLKMAPRWAQEKPKMAPRGPQDKPKRGPREAQEGPKMAPREAQDGPKRAQESLMKPYEALSIAA